MVEDLVISVEAIVRNNRIRISPEMIDHRMTRTIAQLNNSGEGIEPLWAARSCTPRTLQDSIRPPHAPSAQISYCDVLILRYVSLGSK
jgi:hypothetical protein